jgi:uncharacterized protein YbjT (DUF2867 family)
LAARVTSSEASLERAAAAAAALGVLAIAAVVLGAMVKGTPVISFVVGRKEQAAKAGGKKEKGVSLDRRLCAFRSKMGLVFFAVVHLLFFLVHQLLVVCPLQLFLKPSTPGSEFSTSVNLKRAKSICPEDKRKNHRGRRGRTRNRNPRLHNRTSDPDPKVKKKEKTKMAPPPPPQPAVLPPSRVLVAGATGWLGSAVVAELVGRGYHVVALVRDPESPAAAELLASDGGPGGNGGSVVAARGDVTDAESLRRACAAAAAAAAPGVGVSAVVSCVGMRDLAVPDAEIERVLRAGTLNLAAAAAAAGASLFVAVAGGIHRRKDGSVNREMVHNRMREEALEELARRRAEAEAEQARSGARAAAAGVGGEGPSPAPPPPPLPPAVVAIDPSVFFKDAETIFSMIARSVRGGRARLALVEGAWAVKCNPISARDLARRVADALTDQREATPPLSSSSPVRRFRVGGPQVLSFAELAAEAGRALGGGVEVARASLPRPLARALLAAASLLSLFGWRRALAAKRLLSFLWVVGTDESPGSLVGDEACGGDALSAFFEELAARGGAGSEKK